MSPVTASSLSPAWRRLLGLCQQINFGAIEDLVVRDGQPIFDPPPLIIRDVKFSSGAANGPRREHDLAEFVLKDEHRRLQAAITACGTGVIRRLDIQAGLPFRMQIAERWAA
jgi:hypothetical protein